MLLFGKQQAYDAYYKILSNEKDSNALSQIITVAAKYKFNGNLWQNYIAWLIINDENPYSLACERNNSPTSTLSGIALSDIEELYNSFNLKISIIPESYFSDNTQTFSLAEHVGVLVSKLADNLSCAENVYEFKKYTDNFFKDFGVGTFGYGKAFHLENTSHISLKAADYLDSVHFSDICGYDIQKKELIDNTELFLSGKHANNVLLYGDSGTGKSTAIKALLNEYSDRGLRIVEIYKHQFKFLPQVCDILKSRNYFFIIFMDDLSFEDFETEYKYLKALIEGGIEPKPKNVLIYATSNRRHLIKENNSDRSDSDDRHRSDTVQEKLSLSERFGISIYYPKPLSEEYKKIILHLAKIENITLDKDELLKRAHIWGMERGILSGRAAKQFINSLK